MQRNFAILLFWALAATASAGPCRAQPPLQPTTTLDGLYALSRRSVHDYVATMRAHARVSGGTFHTAPLKGRARAIEKMTNQFEGDPRRLIDVVRGTLTYSSVRGVYRGLAGLMDSASVVQLKDAFADPGLGYRHVNLRFRLDSALIVEAQLTTEGYFAAFHGPDGVHGLYEQYRGLKERLSLATPAQRELIARLRAVMRRRFSAVPEDPDAELAALSREAWFTARFRSRVAP